MLSGPTPYKLVEIVWDDASADCSWLIVDQHKEIERELCLTVGFLAKEDKKRVLIAGTLSQDDDDIHINNTISIPKGMIVSLKYL